MTAEERAQQDAARLTDRAARAVQREPAFVFATAWERYWAITHLAFARYLRSRWLAGEYGQRTPERVTP